jgi:hypothetical protein
MCDFTYQFPKAVTETDGIENGGSQFAKKRVEPEGEYAEFANSWTTLILNKFPLSELHKPHKLPIVTIDKYAIFD